jgi:hypothetical protein
LGGRFDRPITVLCLVTLGFGRTQSDGSNGKCREDHRQLGSVASQGGWVGRLWLKFRAAYEKA